MNSSYFMQTSVIEKQLRFHEYRVQRQSDEVLEDLLQEDDDDFRYQHVHKSLCRWCGLSTAPPSGNHGAVRLSDSQACSSKREESQSKRSGHCCSIDYQCKMSDSLSQVSLCTLPHTLTHTELSFALSLKSSAVELWWECFCCTAHPVSGTNCTFPLYSASV